MIASPADAPPDNPMNALAAVSLAASVATPLPQADRRDSAALRDAQAFVKLLLRLRGEIADGGEEIRKDTGRLAALRRNAGNLLPGRGTAWFVQLLFEDAPRDKNPRLAQPELYFLVATLFDLNRHKTVQGDYNFGDLGRSLHLMVAAGSEEKAVERRFKILLDSEFDALPNEFSPSGYWCIGGGEMTYRLRQTVKLLAGQKVGVDWARLIVDLSGWNLPGKNTQKRWARSFYGASREINQAANEADSTEHNSQDA